MGLSTSQGVHNVSDIVQQYLHDAESSPSGLEERSHLAQLCSECILLFQIILKTLPSNSDSASKEMKPMSISLKRSYGRLKIWADENGVIEGTLDATLVASPNLRRDILKYIVSISQTLSERLINLLGINLDAAGLEAITAVRSLATAVAECDSDSSSESGFSDSSSYSVKDILEDLEVDTTCLQDLEPLLCSPILRTDSEPTALLDTTRMTWSPHQPYSDKVSARFPMAADELVTKLGKANYERYLRCQKQKAANELRDTPPDQAILTFPDSASSKFHDSGIGSSLPTTASVYAETVMSYGMGEGRRVRVPPLPAGAKEGLPFACVACGNWVKITTNGAWKQHVYKDLEPWVCLEADCVFVNSTFPTRNDWTTHLGLDHRMDPEWRIIECSLCRVEIGPGKHSITRHMGDHLEEISLSALPADCEFEEESDGDRIDREDDSIQSIVHLEEALEHKPAGLPVEPLSFGVAIATDCSDTKESPAPYLPTRRAPPPAWIGPWPFRSDDSEGGDDSEDGEHGFASWNNDLEFHPPVPEDEYNFGTETESRPQTVAGFVDNSNEFIGGGQSTSFETRIASAQPAQQQQLQHLPPPQQDFVLFDTPKRRVPNRPASQSSATGNSSLNLPQKQNQSSWHLPQDLQRQRAAQILSMHAKDPKSTNAGTPSSYWSVAEMNQFPDLLRRFGTDWEAIALHMTTKTATMVRNFYNKHSGTEKPEWYWIAFECDREREKTLPVFHIDQKMTAHNAHTQETGVQDAARHRQDQYDSYNDPMTASRVPMGMPKDAGKGKEKQQAPAEVEDDYPVSSSPPLSGDYSPGEATFAPGNGASSSFGHGRPRMENLNAPIRHPPQPVEPQEISRQGESSQSPTKNSHTNMHQRESSLSSLAPLWPASSFSFSSTNPNVAIMGSHQDQPGNQQHGHGLDTRFDRAELDTEAHNPQISKNRMGPGIIANQQRYGYLQFDNMASYPTPSPRFSNPWASSTPAPSSHAPYMATNLDPSRYHSPYEETMTTAVIRACDACHRRKVKCDGTNPCHNCRTAQLGCTYHAIPEKKVPKGSRAKALSELRRFNANRTNNEDTVNIPHGSNPTTEAKSLAEQQAQDLAREDVQNMNAAMLQNIGPQNAQQFVQTNFIQQQQNIMRANMESAQQPGTPISQQQVTQGDMGPPDGEQMHPGQNIVNIGGQQIHPEQMQHSKIMAAGGPRTQLQQRLAMQAQQQIQMLSTKLYQDNLGQWLQHQQLTQETCPSELLNKFRMQCMAAAKEKVMQLRQQQHQQRALALQQQDGDEGALRSSTQAATARKD